MTARVLSAIRPRVLTSLRRCGHLWPPPARRRKNRVVLLTRSLMLREEWQWLTNPLPGTSEDHPPLGGKPSEVEVGEEPIAIPRHSHIQFSQMGYTVTFHRLFP